MSSLQKTVSGYRIQFRLDGRLKQVSLSKANRRQAETVQRNIDHLVICRRYGSYPEEHVLKWLKSLDLEFLRILIGLRLCKDIVSESATLIDLFDEFHATKQKLASSTYINYQQLRRKLFACFGQKKLADFTRGDADDFREFCLRTLCICENTTRKRCAQASTFFRWLIRRDLIDFNPFDDVPKSVGTAIERKDDVSAEVINQVLKEAHSPEWRALICLGRWGGIRIPSEAFAMKWTDINWETGRFVVNSSKTAHQNKPSRTVPLFPELVKPLMELQESLPDGAVWVMPRLRLKSGNVREPFKKMIRRAGVKPWPKLWNALRSTRETELAAIYPIHVVCEWMGNTAAVARRHYLKATETDFARASADNAPTTIAHTDTH